MSARKFTLTVVAVFVLLAAQTIRSQCVRDQIKADRLRGQVLIVDSNQPLPGVVIKLLRAKGDVRETVVEATAGAEGRFDVGFVSRGKYFLEVREPGFDTIVTEVKIVKSALNARSSFLTIRLAPPDYSGTDSCEGSVGVSTRPLN
jgi:5-hydroxyisourate hydrolase-like protein (transthyretin family)